MQTYQVAITGKTPLLLHHDNLDWADEMEVWKSNPEHSKTSKPGDDRTPAWRWLGCCYHDGKVLGIPQANIMRSLMEGGAMVPVPGGKMEKTFKSQTQSGMSSTDPLWPLQVGGKVIEWPAVNALRTKNAFGGSSSRDYEAGIRFACEAREDRNEEACSRAPDVCRGLVRNWIIDRVGRADHPQGAERHPRLCRAVQGAR